MQLLTGVIPALEKMAQEGRVGYERINQYTRYLTVLICFIQGFMLALWLENPQNFRGTVVVANPGLFFRFMTVLTLTTGTVFLMWLGEQIQERGIGNGISLIITASIISRIPAALHQLWVLYSPFDPARRQISTPVVLFLILLWIAVVIGVVLFTQAQRRIPVQYGRRIIGRRI